MQFISPFFTPMKPPSSRSFSPESSPRSITKSLSLSDLQNHSFANVWDKKNTLQTYPKEKLIAALEQARMEEELQTKHCLKEEKLLRENSILRGKLDSAHDALHDRSKLHEKTLYEYDKLYYTLWRDRIIFAAVSITITTCFFKTLYHKK